MKSFFSDSISITFLNNSNKEITKIKHKICYVLWIKN